MWEINEGDLVRYRCHVGHAFTEEVLGLALEDNLARAMGSAVRALEERVALAHKLHQQAREADRRHLAETWAQRARDLAQEAEVIRTSLRRLEEIAPRTARPAESSE